MSNKVKPPDMLVIPHGKEEMAAASYVGIWEAAFLTPPIEFGKGDYKLLTIYSGRHENIAADHFHKFHILDSERKMVRREEIAEYCLKVYLTYYTIMISQNDINHTLKEGPVSLGKIQEQLAGIRVSMINGYEQEFRKQHKLFQEMADVISYMDQQKNLQGKMYEYAVRIEAMKTEIEEVGKIQENAFLSLLEATSQFKAYARQRGILLIQTQNKLRIVRSLLKDELMQKYLHDEEKKILPELLKKLSTEIDYQQIVFHTHGRIFVTSKGYIRKLQETPEDFIRLQAEEFVRQKWLVYKKQERFTLFKKRRKVE